MTELNESLRRGYAVFARRRIPDSWAEREPSLAAYAEPAELVGAIRKDALNPRSDALVRSLIHLSADQPDAIVILLEAVTPRLFGRMIGGQSIEYRDAILLDLVAVILESGDLDGLDHLVRRLANRAYKRAQRRWFADKLRGETEIYSESGVSLAATAPSIEDEVVIRVEFEAVRETVNQALESGELTADEWDIVRTCSIEPRLGFERPDVDKDYVYRRVRKVRELLAHAS